MLRYSIYVRYIIKITSYFQRRMSPYTITVDFASLITWKTGHFTCRNLDLVTSLRRIHGMHYGTCNLASVSPRSQMPILRGWWSLPTALAWMRGLSKQECSLWGMYLVENVFIPSVEELGPVQTRELLSIHAVTRRIHSLSSFQVCNISYSLVFWWTATIFIYLSVNWSILGNFRKCSILKDLLILSITVPINQWRIKTTETTSRAVVKFSGLIFFF